MTEMELEAIAREYAEVTVAPISEYYVGNLGGSNREDDLQTVREDIAIPFLKWISDRFEIVAKEKIRELHKRVDYTKEYASINRLEKRAKLLLLESLFPETLKDEK